MARSVRKKIKDNISKINKDLMDIKCLISDITAEVKQDYPHISALLLTCLDTVAVLQSDFVDALDKEF